MTAPNFDTQSRSEEAADARRLRNLVSNTVSTAWPQFVVDHPALARVIDPELLKDYTFDSLADDAAFTQAYRKAVDARVTIHAMSNLIEPFVSLVIARLL